MKWHPFGLAIANTKDIAESGTNLLKTTLFSAPKTTNTRFLPKKGLERKNEQLLGKCGLTSRLALVAPLYHQTETTGIMKTIQTIIGSFRNILRLNTIKETPQLIAISQENFCQNMAITDYYCDENNLFI